MVIVSYQTIYYLLHNQTVRQCFISTLRAAVTNQILTPEQLFLWANENINGVTMYYVTREDIIGHKKKYDLKVYYNGVQTAPQL